jgi:hypothetical protein
MSMISVPSKRDILLGMSFAFMRHNGRHSNANKYILQLFKIKPVSIEIQRMWNMKCFVIPIDTGAIGLQISLSNTRKELNAFSTKRRVVLETSHLTRKYYNLKA